MSSSLDPDAGQDQLSMLHRLPSARVVDRLDYVTRAATRRRVAHIGFADAGYHEMQEGAGTWLHARLAGVATTLVGLDVDEDGVARARDAGYEAYVVDCRSTDAVVELGLAPAEVVIAGEVIEHIDQPGPFLEAMHVLVGPGGRLLLTTPNASGLGNTLLALGGYEINHPDHVTLFSFRTISALLERHGWEVDDVATYVPILKPLRGGGVGRKVIAAGARTMLALERGAGRLGAPFIADGLIVAARSTRS